MPRVSIQPLKQSNKYRCGIPNPLISLKINCAKRNHIAVACFSYWIVFQRTAFSLTFAFSVPPSLLNLFRCDKRIFLFIYLLFFSLLRRCWTELLRWNALLFVVVDKSPLLCSVEDEIIIEGEKKRWDVSNRINGRGAGKCASSSEIAVSIYRHRPI